MATKPLRLTRNQLAQFLKDQEQIRAFENLFTLTEPLARTTLDDLDQQAGSALSAAVAAQDHIHDAEQALSVMLAACEAKATQALQQVQALEHVAQLVETMPPPQQPARERYGTFYDTTTQTAAAINTAYAMTFNTTQFSQGVTRETPTSRIYVDTVNIYNIQFSAQINTTVATDRLLWIWLRKNGTDVPDSATQIRTKGNNFAAVAARNFLLEMNQGDYFELMWAADSTGVQLQTFAASGFYPAIPSVILTVTNNISSDGSY
jgi:hypothetical protein